MYSPCMKLLRCWRGVAGWGVACYNCVPLVAALGCGASWCACVDMDMRTPVLDFNGAWMLALLE